MSTPATEHVVTICPICGYTVLPALDRCSECGTACSEFSKLSRSKRLSRNVARLAVILACWPLAIEAYVLLVMCVARLCLGRWPVPSLDDPKSIPLVSELMLPFWALLMTMVPAIIGAIGCVAIVAVIPRSYPSEPRERGHAGRVVRTLLTVVVLIVLGFTIVRSDPFEAVTWAFD